MIIMKLSFEINIKGLNRKRMVYSVKFRKYHAMDKSRKMPRVHKTNLNELNFQYSFLFCLLCFLFQQVFDFNQIQQYIPPHITTYQYKSLHITTYHYISLHITTYPYISLHIATYRYISREIYSYKHFSKSKMSKT